MYGSVCIGDLEYLIGPMVDVQILDASYSLVYSGIWIKCHIKKSLEISSIYPLSDHVFGIVLESDLKEL